MKKILILYIPVIHQGYLDLVKRHKEEVSEIFVLGKDLIDELSSVKEIRAIDPKVAVKLLKAFDGSISTGILFQEYFNRGLLNGLTVIISNDELSRRFAEKYLKDNKIEIDTAFLRWDEKTVFSKSDVATDRVSHEGIDLRRMRLAKEAADSASDWWRQVGCVLVKDSLVIFKTHNRHLPSEHTPYMVGDPRDFVEAGKNSELTSAIHSEQSAIAWAAREGVSLKGTSLYVTVFPCPVCAKLIAHSGISKVFYLTGHASLDGVDILKSKDVEIVHVKVI